MGLRVYPLYPLLRHGGHRDPALQWLASNLAKLYTPHVIFLLELHRIFL